MEDMQLADVSGEGEQQTLTFNDSSTREVITVDREIPFPEGRLIVSRTDPSGMITHVNRPFVEMSGYTEAELIGQPHNILRHPEMPRAAFQGLWETVSEGNKWSGYVKNLRKDGAFYWVYAVVVPNVRHGEIIGYSSVRRKPSRNKIAEAKALYATLD